MLIANHFIIIQHGLNNVTWNCEKMLFAALFQTQNKNITT